MPQYFAEIENGIVKRVIVADQSFIDSGVVGDPKNWVETFIDGSKRGNYAGVGDKYDKDKDAFIAPQPYPSWSLNEKLQWQPPKTPLNKLDYVWNESKLDFDLIADSVESATTP